MSSAVQVSLIPIVFLTLVLAQRFFEVVRSNTNKGLNLIHFGRLELIHVGWTIALLAYCIFMEPIYIFWVLLLYLVLQAVRAVYQRRVGNAWTVEHLPLNNRNVWKAVYAAEPLLLGLAFGHYAFAVGLGIANALLLQFLLWPKAKTLAHK